MAVDPRLDQLGRAGNAKDRVAQQLADLDRRVSAMEAGGRRTYAGQGAPTIAAPDGAMYVDTTTNRFYARSGGVWRYVALT